MCRGRRLPPIHLQSRNLRTDLARPLCHRHHHDTRQRPFPMWVHLRASDTESPLRHAAEIRRHQWVRWSTAPSKKPPTGPSPVYTSKNDAPREKRHQIIAIIRSTDQGFPPEVADRGLEVLHDNSQSHNTILEKNWTTDYVRSGYCVKFSEILFLQNPARKELAL